MQSIEEKGFDEMLVVGLIKDKRKIWKKGSGRNLFKSLEKEFTNHRIKIGRDKFFRILSKHNLLIKRKSRKAITTMSYHHYHKYPNLIIGITPMKANEIWVSDITYIWLEEENCFSYLFLITDMYSRKVVGYCISKSLSREGAIRSYKMAKKELEKEEIENCIHHSDRGVQYCSYDYTDMLKADGLQISMTENSDPRENAIAERINRTIKEEFTEEKTITFNNFTEAKRQMKKIINFYNSERPHSSIEMLTPNEAYKMKGALKRCWKNYYKTKTIDGEFIKA